MQKKKLVKSEIGAGKIGKLEGEKNNTWQLYAAVTWISQSISR